MFSDICGQRMSRSACASAQSDQGLHCPQTEILDTTKCMTGSQDWIVNARMKLRMRRMMWFCALKTEKNKSLVFSGPYGTGLQKNGAQKQRYFCYNVFFFFFFFVCLFLFCFVFLWHNLPAVFTFFSSFSFCASFKRKLFPKVLAIKWIYCCN